MKNWKTTTFALIAAAAGFIAMHPMYTAHYPIINDIAGYIMVGGFAGLGLSAKDSSTHSTGAEVVGASIKADGAGDGSSKSTLVIKDEAGTVAASSSSVVKTAETPQEKKQ